MTAADPDRLAQALAHLEGRKYARDVQAVLGVLGQRPRWRHRRYGWLTVDVARAARVGIDRTTFILDALERMGLATRHTPSPTHWTITPAGRARL